MTQSALVPTTALDKLWTPAKQRFKDSYVLIFHGSRRGGKTLSMVVQCIIDMIRGRKVFSNFPIRFVFRGRLYESLRLDYYALLAQDEMYIDSVIAWDETAFWLYARNPNAGFNKICTLVLTLIGKWECNFYSTVQFLNMLDKNVRQQADAIVLCTDLSFRYKQLGRGTTIGQLCQDISGRFTGTMYEMSHDVYQRTLHGKWAWTAYDTKKAFDIFETQRKVKMNVSGVTISKGSTDGDGQYIEPGTLDGEGHYSRQEARTLLPLQHIIGEFVEEGKSEVTPTEFGNRMINRGLNVSQYQLRQLMPMLGIQLDGDRYHTKYILPSLEEAVT